MAGVVVRADILEDKDGKSRGIGTVTFEQAIEAVQAICILGQQSWEWGKELGSHSRGRMEIVFQGRILPCQGGSSCSGWKMEGKAKQRQNSILKELGQLAQDL